MVLTDKTWIAGALAVICVLTAAGCGRGAATVESRMAVCLPADAHALLGVKLDELRSSTLLAALPARAGAFLEPLRDSSYLLMSYGGADTVAVVKGAFREPPSGATLVDDGMAVAGSPSAIAAALSQAGAGAGGPQWLVGRASPVSSASAVWLIARGGASLPLGAEAAVAGRLLAMTDYAAVGLSLKPAPALDATAVALTEENARHFEESFRALLTLAAAAARGREGSAALSSFHVSRDGLTVRVHGAIQAETAARLLAALFP